MSIPHQQHPSLYVRFFPADHPIRRIRVVVDTVLAELDDVFDAMYSKSGRPSVPPEMILMGRVLYHMSAWARAIARSDGDSTSRTTRSGFAALRLKGGPRARLRHAAGLRRGRGAAAEARARVPRHCQGGAAPRGRRRRSERGAGGAGG